MKPNAKPMRLAGLSLIFFCSLSVRGWAAEDKDVLAEIQKQAAAIKTLSAQFTSVKRVSFLNDPIRTRGRLLFESPARVLWEVAEPFKAAVMYDGKTAVRYMPDAQGHWARQNEGPDPVLAETMHQLQMWLSGQALAASEAYEISALPGPPVQVRLIPKHPGMRKFIAALNLSFGANLSVVETLALTEGSGDETKITFSQTNLNQPIPPHAWLSE